MENDNNNIEKSRTISSKEKKRLGAVALSDEGVKLPEKKPNKLAEFVLNKIENSKIRAQNKLAERNFREATDLLKSNDSARTLIHLGSMIQDNEIDIREDRVQQLYIEALDKLIFSQGIDDQRREYFQGYDIDRALELGLPMETILSDNTITNATTDIFIEKSNWQLENVAKDKDTYNYGSRPNFDYGSRPNFDYDFPIKISNTDFFLKILDDPTLLEKIRQSTNIQEYGNQATLDVIDGDRNYYIDNNMHKERINNNIAILRKLGFDNTHMSDENFTKIMEHSVRQSRAQERLCELNLISPETVDAMYKNRLDWAKKFVSEHYSSNQMGDKTELEEYEVFDIYSKLRPSQGNEMANYWRTQSDSFNKLTSNITMSDNRDAFSCIFSKLVTATQKPSLVTIHPIFEDMKSDKGIGMAYFSKDGIPQQPLFDYFLNSIENLGIIGRADICSFLYQNIDRIDNVYQKSFIKALYDLYLYNIEDPVAEELIRFATSQMKNIENTNIEDFFTKENDSGVKLWKRTKEILSDGYDVFSKNNDMEAFNIACSIDSNLIKNIMNAPKSLKEANPESFAVNQDNILSCLSAFINFDANDWSIYSGIPTEIRDKIKETFTNKLVKD
ncbi:MAG: hypothetical protein LBM09_00285, partial [Candidatus Nomurabacteria bacterium]|nr:hypothetical protein [Candidatus Nomurabacteria bacterium]